MKSNRQSGFSLIEVVVAVGIFAFAIVGVLGLLTPTGKAISAVADNDAASRAISAIQGGLQEYVVNYPVAAGQDKFQEFAKLFGQKLYSSRDGSKVGDENRKNKDGSSYWGTGNNEKFFEVVLTRDTTLSPASADTTSGFLAFTVTLKWPAYLPNGQPVDDQQKDQLSVPAAVTR